MVIFNFVPCVNVPGLIQLAALVLPIRKAEALVVAASITASSAGTSVRTADEPPIVTKLIWVFSRAVVSRPAATVKIAPPCFVSVSGPLLDAGATGRF